MFVSKSQLILQSSMYLYIDDCRPICVWVFAGIFEKHKLLFSLQIAIKVQQNAGEVKQAEVDFFVKVCTLIDNNS